MDLAGQHRSKPVSGGIGPAGAVAKVAHRWHVSSSGGVVHALAAFARERPGAALGNEIHVAGMEIHAEGRNRALSRRAHNGRASRGSNAAVGGAIRIDPESLVLFNDPAII